MQSGKVVPMAAGASCDPVVLCRRSSQCLPGESMHKFVATLLFMLAVAVGLIVFFKSKKWL